MTQTTARLKQKGKNFEIIVDLEKALAFKQGKSNTVNFLEIDKIFDDSKKGFVAPERDMNDVFKTIDINEIARKIVKQGEVLLTQDYRDEKREKKIKQVIDFLATNAVNPQTGNPHPAERIKNALEQAGVNIKDAPIEDQISDIVEELKKVLAIKIETKKIKIKIPAVHTGKVYGIINQYKEKENWKSDGGLECVVNVPAGLLMDFYDKLNAVTHGSALTEELKQGDEE